MVDFRMAYTILSHFVFVVCRTVQRPISLSHVKSKSTTCLPYFFSLEIELNKISIFFFHELRIINGLWSTLSFFCPRIRSEVNERTNNTLCKFQWRDTHTHRHTRLLHEFLYTCDSVCTCTMYIPIEWNGKLKNVNGTEYIPIIISYDGINYLMQLLRCRPVPHSHRR